MLIVFSLAGQSHLAADLGLAQASTSVLFYAFSGNARNVILSGRNTDIAKSLFNIRLVLLVPLTLLAFWLNLSFGGVTLVITLSIILRRAGEWMGEVDLAERERNSDRQFALLYITIQAAVFAVAALWLILHIPDPVIALMLWAGLPLLLHFKYAAIAIKELRRTILMMARAAIPQFGSTIAISVSLYMFRILLVLLVGKAVAGDLFAAFAIGGILGSISLNALAPAIAYHEKLHGITTYPKWLTFALLSCLVAGATISGLADYVNGAFDWSHKSILFWQALGLSMIGGVVMTRAQVLRSRLLIQHADHDLFGPDLLMNLLIVAAVPFGYYVYGLSAMSTLSLFSAILAYGFYKSSELAEVYRLTRHPHFDSALGVAVATAIVVPIFVTMGGGIYANGPHATPQETSLTTVPLPISLFLAYFFILVIGSYRSTRTSLTFVFFTFILMFFTNLSATPGQTGMLERSKTILIIQYLAPMGAIILGQMYGSNPVFNSNNRMERTFMFVLFLILIVQLFNGWANGDLRLQPGLSLFRIYHHLSEVPNVMVAAFLIFLFGIGGKPAYRAAAVGLALLMEVYSAAAFSIVTMVFLNVGMLLFGLLEKPRRQLRALSILLLLTCAGLSYRYLVQAFYDVSQSTTNSYTSLLAESWRRHFEVIFRDASSLLLGNAETGETPGFLQSPNYYVELIQNFGLISFVPFALFFIHTLRRLWSMVKENLLDAPLAGLVYVLFFLLCIDNSMRASLRQPYSGVFTFFIWGLSLSRLSSHSGKKNVRPV
jgi:hypothetical protein